jgi:hypothetical protein
MKILVVAIADSVHTVRWINQIRDQDWDICIFPATDSVVVHKDLRSEKILIPFFKMYLLFERFGYGKYFNLAYILAKKIFANRDNEYYSKRLSRYINKRKPDLVHSLETQGAGYLTNKAFKINKKITPWWHTNWGSDIFLFGRLEDHQKRIREVLARCDYYSCECERDVQLAIKNGFKGCLLPVYPNAGGFDIDSLVRLRNTSDLTSNRKLIMLKGYQGWAGRALVGIRALERCSDLLMGYEIVIYSNTNAVDVQIAASLLSNSADIPVKLLPNDTSHEQILEYHSKARISIGLSISDAISTSMLEAMAMGSFPIQSCTACASEWILNNETGLIVPPEDPEIIEGMIRKALLDDNLVNNAAVKNFQTISSRMDYNTLKDLTIQSYKKILTLSNEK